MVNQSYVDHMHNSTRCKNRMKELREAGYQTTFVIKVKPRVIPPTSQGKNELGETVRKLEEPSLLPKRNTGKRSTSAKEKEQI
eukprot:Pgem_evm3s4945